MHDIVIRGTRMPDGTGAAAFTGDVPVARGRIAAVSAGGRATLVAGVRIFGNGAWPGRLMRAGR